MIANVFQMYEYDAIILSYALFEIKILSHQPDSIISILSTISSFIVVGYGHHVNYVDFYYYYMNYLNI